MMNSLSVMSFKKSIEEFVKTNELPAEVKRLVLREIYEDTQKAALQEALSEATKMEEKTNADF